MKQILANASTSGLKGAAASTVTALMGAGADMTIENGLYGYTRGFCEGIKAFYGWVDDAMVYIWGK